MDSLRPVLAAIVGLILGGGLAWATRAPAEVVEADPVRIELAEPLPVDCPDRAVVLTGERDRLRDEISAVELQIRIMEHRRIAREGEVAEWPEDPDPLQVPQTFEGHVRAALEEIDGDLIRMDCDEYPCIVSVSTDGSAYEGSGTPSSALNGVFDALNDRGYVDHELVVASMGREGDTFWGVFALQDPDEADFPTKRTSFRQEQIREEVYDQISEEGL